MARDKVGFELHTGVNSLEFATSDGRLVRLERGKAYHTDDPEEIAVLDVHGRVKRVSDASDQHKAKEA